MVTLSVPQRHPLLLCTSTRLLITHQFSARVHRRSHRCPLHRLSTSHSTHVSSQLHPRGVTRTSGQGIFVPLTHRRAPFLVKSFARFDFTICIDTWMRYPLRQGQVSMISMASVRRSLHLTQTCLPRLLASNSSTNLIHLCDPLALTNTLGASASTAI